MLDRPTAGNSADVVLEFESVSRDFGPVHAVSQVSFQLFRGEIVTLLGASGCGKTTTLRMAMGLERSSGGRVLSLGRVVDSAPERIFVPPEKRNMGMVFQSYAIWPHLTVFENVAYPLRIRRKSTDEIRDKVGRTLELVGLAEYADRPATHLSGGQQQRVAVARAIVFDPTLLLMDEPFSSLDAKLREQVRAELKVLQRRLGITILFVTHDQSEALAISDRLAVMSRGRMEHIGTPLELYTHPGSPTVRDFLGRTLLLRGKLLERHDGTALVRLDEGPIARVGGDLHIDVGRAGGPCVVALRPEQIDVRPVSSAAPSTAENCLPATIRALLFLGDRFEASVELPSGGGTTVFLPPTGAWHEGQRLELALPADRLQLWDPE